MFFTHEKLPIQCFFSVSEWLSCSDDKFLFGSYFQDIISVIPKYSIQTIDMYDPHQCGD